MLLKHNQICVCVFLTINNTRNWAFIVGCFVCVCACVRACVRVCVRACVRVCVFFCSVYVNGLTMKTTNRIHTCKQTDRKVHCAVMLINRRSSEIQGTALSIYRSMPAGVAQSRHAFVRGTVSTWGR